MSTIIEENAVVLFQGDSITDAGRSRDNDTILGGGYANMAEPLFSAKYPDRNVTFLNRGISGNRASDLRGRWKADCIDLKPTWVSVLIGINDTWQAFDSNDATSTDAYEADYREILTQVRDKLGARLILCEPFVLPYPEDRKAWRKDLDPRIHVVRQLVREFEAVYVPFDALFAAACRKREPSYWAGDGVHPTQPGHALMAWAWLDAVAAL